MPGVDVAYRHYQNHDAPQDGRTTTTPATSLPHRNRGLCSVPRAYQWIDYSHGVAFWLQTLELRAWKHKLVPPSKNNNDDTSSSSSSRQQERPGSAGMDDQEEEEEEEWMEVASLTSGATIVQAIERVQYALANDPPPELGDGSHILHVLLDDIATPQGETPTSTTTTASDTPTTTTTQFDSPKTGFELCVVLQERREDDNGDDGATIPQSPRTPRRVVVPYQQPNVHGILHVSVSATMAGSESDYLPDVYRPLYDDLSLRNPTYEQFRERRRRQQQQQLLQGQGQRGKGSGEL
jgi:hypothetical protein